MSKGTLLKPDNGILRYVDRGTRNEPIDPLTKKEKDMLIEKCWEKCKNAYCRRISSGFMADFDEDGDLIGEAFILMNNILAKFDKSKCGEIHPDEDIPGKKAPKTLMFYFKNYFYGRVNFTAAEARDFKNKRGVGPGGAVDGIIYDEEDDPIDKDPKSETMSLIFEHLLKKNFEFKRFFVQLNLSEMSATEMREEWGKEFNELSQEVDFFYKDMKKSLESKYKKEFGKK